MSTTVRIPTQLRTVTDGQGEVEATGSTLRDVLADIEARHPGLEARVLDDEGRLRRFVNVYVEDEDVRFLDGLATPIADGARVSIIPAVSGGS
jgi:molybdopterin converting factor small subunit